MCVQSLTPGKNQCYAIQLKVLTQGIEIQSPEEEPLNFIYVESIM